MAIPTSGEIRMSQINTELGRASTSQISLDAAENGSYAAINTNSSSRPSSSNPATMSEWRGYNHSTAAPTTAPPVTCGPISVGYNATNRNTACSNWNSGTVITVYSSPQNLSTSTILYRTSCGSVLRAAGYYSNGVITRYWNGSAFTTQFDCIV